MSSSKSVPFFGVYLLCSEHDKYKGCTYIGFTVNPSRRIRQHNGEITNGAYRTSRKRPWKMVMIVHGFPNQKEALRFEWHYQNAQCSKLCRERVRRIKPCGPKYKLRYQVHVVHEMLHCSPWNTYPLQISYFEKEYLTSALLLECMATPTHMVTSFTSLFELKYDQSAMDEDENEEEGNREEEEEGNHHQTLCENWFGNELFTLDGYEEEQMYENLNDSDREALLIVPDSTTASSSCCCSQSNGSRSDCTLCHTALPPLFARCTHGNCSLRCHLVCLARNLLKDTDSDTQNNRVQPLIPVEGSCPACKQSLTWAEVIRKWRRQELAKAAAGTSKTDGRKRKPSVWKSRPPRIV